VRALKFEPEGSFSPQIVSGTGVNPRWQITSLAPVPELIVTPVKKICSAKLNENSG